MVSYFHTIEEINRQNEVNIILGDFNINIIEGNQRISTVLSNYTEIGREPTDIFGSLIDHVYIQNGFLESVNATSLIVGVYFSDHDAVRFCISNKLCEQIFLTFAYCVCFSSGFFSFLISFKQISMTF